MNSRREIPLPLLLIDEISLEGLEGITLEGIWKILGAHFRYSLPLKSDFKNQIWTCIKSHFPHLKFYELPKPRENYKIFNRKDYCVLKTLHILLPDECPMNRYPYNPIEENGERGSCEFYKERRNIALNELEDLTVEEIEEKFGNKFVIVASQVLRENALFPESVIYLSGMPILMYCFLEVIGRSRFNGEVTAGKFPIQYMCKDGGILYYMKTKLMQKKLIVRQYYTEDFDRSLNGFLFQLPRFYNEFKPRTLAIVEILYDLIQTKENRIIAMSEVTGRIRKEMINIPLKNILKMNVVKKFFSSDLIKYREYYPNATEAEYKNRGKSGEKGIRVVKLNNKSTTLAEIVDSFEEKDKEDADSDKTDWMDPSKCYIDYPPTERIFEIIDSQGTEGISQSNIIKSASLNYYLVRRVLTKLLKIGAIKNFYEDIGRQRTTMYLSLRAFNDKNRNTTEGTTDLKGKNYESPEMKNLSTSTSSSLKENENKNSSQEFPVTTDSKEEEDISNIESNMRGSSPIDLKSDEKEKFEDTVIPVKSENAVDVSIKRMTQSFYRPCKRKNKHTQRQTNRRNIILNLVKLHKIVDVIKVMKSVRNEEASQGVAEILCIKSLWRIIFYLQEMNLIDVYEVILTYKNVVRYNRFICQASITPDSKVFQDEVQRCQQSLYYYTHEREHRIETRLNYQLSREMVKKGKTVNIIRPPIIRPPIMPKFLRARIYHEFLVYIARELKSDTNPIEITDEILNKWRANCDDSDIEEIRDELPPIYSKDGEINPFMFVPPIPEYKFESGLDGWVQVRDILLRFPLSVLVKANKLTKTNKMIESYLKHPIKQHYLLVQLPLVLKNYLGQLRLFIYPFHDCFNLLAAMGLLQIGPRIIRDHKEQWVYVNRVGTILDTIESEPGYDCISTNKDYPELEYKFTSIEIVSTYWNDLNKICLTSNLGKRGFYSNSTDDECSRIKKRKEIPKLSSVKFPDAPIRDTGRRPGDNRGAGGLDTSLYTHLSKNWWWNLMCTKTNSSKVRTKKVSGKSKMPTVRLSTLKNDKQRTHEQTKAKKVTLISGKKIVIRRRVNNKLKESERRQIRDEYDNVDKEALKLMDSLRVRWLPAEDRALQICKTVYMFLNKAAALRYVPYSVVRDILHWATKSINKTSRACARRLMYLPRLKGDLPDVSVWLHELKRSEYINKFYGDTFWSDLRSIYPNEQDFTRAIRVHFIKLFYYLRKIINANLLTEKKTILPDTLNEFYQFYKESNGNPQEEVIRNPNTEKDIKVFTVHALIHSSICCAKDKTLYNVQLFEIYKYYSEEILERAYNNVRALNMVVVNKTCLKSNKNPFVQYVLSGRYRLQMFVSLPQTIIDLVYESFKKYSLNNSPQNVDEQDESKFTQANSGLCLFLAEMICCSKKDFDIEIQLPSRILVVDPNQENFNNYSDRLLDHFRRLFENAPRKEYLKQLEQIDNSQSQASAESLFDENNSSFSITQKLNIKKEITEKENESKTNSSGKLGNEGNRPRTRFSIINESIRLQYSPYDILSKLHEDYIHFFCALNHLNKIVDLNFNKLQSSLNEQNKTCEKDIQEKKCFFNCVLNHGNLFTMIEQIVQEKRDLIELLTTTSTETDSTTKESDSSDEIIEGKVMITPKNLMKIFRKHQEILRLNFKEFDKKDSGKINMRTLQVDVIELTKELLDFTMNEEQQNLISQSLGDFEQTFNKDEKIIKANDIFVVNLPAIKISQKKSKDANLENYEKYKILTGSTNITKIQEEIIEKVMREYIWNGQSSHLKKLIEVMKREKVSSEEQQITSDVLNCIEEKTLGAYAKDLLKITNNENVLVKCVNILRKQNLVMRVGVKSYCYVSKKNLDPWIIHTYHIKRLEKESMPSTSKSSSEISYEPPMKRSRSSKLEDNIKEEFKEEERKRHRDIIIMRPAPWMRVNGSLNRRVLDKWIVTILMECIVSNGLKVTKLYKRFSCLYPVNILFLLEILRDLKCLKLEVCQVQQHISLFSNYDAELETSEATEFSNIDNVFVKICPNAVTNLSLFVGDKKYKSDFI